MQEDWSSDEDASKRKATGGRDATPPIRHAQAEGDGKGKAKGKPRGKAFQKGSDPRRKQEQEGEGEGQGQGGPPPFQTFVTSGVEAADKVLLHALQKLQAKATKAAEQAAIDAAEMQAAAAADAAPTFKIDLTQADGAKQAIEMEGLFHAVFPDVLQCIEAGLQNILLIGPAGSGKTTLGRQIAAALGMPEQFGSVSFTSGASESVVTGRLLPTGEGGRFEYAPVPFVTLYEGGGVFLADEIDAADANVLLGQNSGIGNGFLDLPNRLANPVAHRHPRFVYIAAGNTYGLGATRQYVGRNQLDAAYLDRFAGSVIEMGYDENLEAKLVARILPHDKARAPWLERYYEIRAAIERVALRRIWGTRGLVNGAKHIAKGRTVKQAIAKLTVGWTLDEMQKAGAV